MGIKLRKIIKAGVFLGLFLSVFFSVGAVNAQTPLKCCILKRFTIVNHGSGTPIGCRIKPTSGGCRLEGRCVQEEPGTLYGTNCKMYEYEDDFPCSSDTTRCSEEILAKTANCPGLEKTPCEAASTCFWSPLNRCFSIYDNGVCGSLNNSDCSLKSKVCKVVGDKCVGKLEQSLNEVYGGNQPTGMFLTACAVQGTCTDVNEILEVVIKIAKQMFGFVGVISFAFFVYGGFTMIIAFGNAEKFKHGQQILVSAVIGIVITFSAYLIVKFVLDALGVAEGFRIIQ